MTTTDPRRTEYLPLAALKPDPANPKSHDMEALDASVGRFGFVEGITVDERTGYIVAGHGRHKALTDMEARGETPPEGVTVSEDGDWLVPVQRGWSSRTDAEARAYLIASNRTSELGGWVDDSLLSALDELDGDFTGVGFGEDDLDDLRAKLEATKLVDQFMSQSEEESYLESGSDSVGSITLDEDTHECVVVIPVDRYEDFYSLMHETEWVKDVRDRK